MRGPHGVGAEPLDLELGLEGLELATEGVAPRLRVHQTEMVPVEHNHPRARPEHRAPAPDVVADRLLEAVPLDRLRDRRALPARDHETVQTLQLLGTPDLDGRRAERTQDARVRGEVPLGREDPDAEAGLACHYEPRCWRREPSSASWAMSSPRIGSPSSVEAAATRSGSA